MVKKEKKSFYVYIGILVLSGTSGSLTRRKPQLKVIIITQKVKL
jgi:hypothetical protein